MLDVLYKTKFAFIFLLTWSIAKGDGNSDLLKTDLESATESERKYCEESNIRCLNGWCYRPIDKCDGWKDCLDNYDESPELCKDAPDITKFYCYNGKEINITQVCDGITDCNDGTDEEDAICNDESAENCAIPNTITLTIQCEFKGVPIPCEFQARAWATAKIFCNLGYVPTNDTQWISINKCRSSGKWIHRMPRCTFDCGTPLNGNEAWNVIIYERVPHVRERFEIRCHGTLVTPFHVLTEDRCTFRAFRGDIEKVPLEVIKVGVTSIGINEKNSEPEYVIRTGSYRQEVRKLMDVVEITRISSWDKYISYQEYHEIKERFIESQRASERNSTNNESLSYDDVRVKIILLELNTHVDVHKYKSVCFDVDHKFEFNRNATGRVVARVKYPLLNTYNLLNLQILSKEHCEKFVNKFYSPPNQTLSFIRLNFDQFCGYYKSCEYNCTSKQEKMAKSSAEIKQGSGLTTKIDGKYYLIGIFVGIMYVLDNDINLQVHVFSDVRIKMPPPETGGLFLNLAVEELKTFDSNYLRRVDIKWEKKTCPVPFSYGTAYTNAPCTNTKRGCPELLSHQKVEEHSVIFMYCQKNYTLKNDCNYKVCEKGKWIPENNTCVRVCEPLLTTPTVKTECSYEGKNTSCTDKVMADTVATSTCQIEVNKDLTSYENKCLHSGNWRDSPEVIQVLCIDLCGIIKSERALIQDGAEADSTYHPWNAGLYYKYKNEPYRHMCGGTLISRYAVLTAAHCVQNSPGIVIRPGKLKIGLGKFFRELYHPSDIQAQILDVENVFASGLYGGNLSSFTSDIAIIELKNPADNNDFVVPACIDTSNKFSVKENFTGTVVGWGHVGLGNDSKQSDVLMKAELPYVTRQTCIQLSKNKYNITVPITIDKFCAFNIKDGKPIVRLGDSGAGLTFKFDGRHFVYGVVSLQAKYRITMFTNVTYPDHLEFINKKLNEILENKKKNEAEAPK